MLSTSLQLTARRVKFCLTFLYFCFIIVCCGGFYYDSLYSFLLYFTIIVSVILIILLSKITEKVGFMEVFWDILSISCIIVLPICLLYAIHVLYQNIDNWHHLTIIAVVWAITFVIALKKS
jgi:carbon starvation protein CstA